MALSRLKLVLVLGLCSLAALRGEAKVVEVELTIASGEVDFSGDVVEALTVNGGIPGPTLEFTEGDVARIHVRNELDVPSSVHWHGLLVPNPQDGVPLVTFPGIPAHSVFTYEFPIRQAGTYWYHSHSGLQEQRGVYGSIVIHPRDGPLHAADHDYVVVLSDWTDENPDHVMGLLKSENDWYAVKRNTNQSVWGALRRGQFGDYLRRDWESMPENEISDVAYDRFLIDGRTDRHFAAKPGETVRLRIINAGSATYFYMQFAGGNMTVIAADGQDVVPFETERFLIAIAETYDVLITVPGEGNYELRATAQDGSGFVNALIGSGKRVVAPNIP
ncbi:MAG: multicopper oxidase domain-containing protein, partial [Myxococcota bacterium]